MKREVLSLTGITPRETGEPGKGARLEMMVQKGGYWFGKGPELLKKLKRNMPVPFR